MKKFLLLALLLSAVTAGGCATHISGLQDKAGAQTLYVFNDEHEAFAAAYGVIVAVVPNAPVKASSGPMRGYSVKDDESVFDVRILPGTGRNIAGRGENVSGYYVETSLQSESIVDRFIMQKIYKAIVEAFAHIGKPVQVDAIKLGKYKNADFLYDSEEDGLPVLSGFAAGELNRLSQPDESKPLEEEKIAEEKLPPPAENIARTTSRESGAGRVSIADELGKLHQLRQSGGLSREEYNMLKERILRE